MAKRADSTYAPGEETGEWVKHKVQPAEDFIVGGYVPGNNGIEELVVGRREGKKLLYMSSVRAGFVARTRKLVFAAVRELRQEECPFSNLPEKKGEHKMDAAKMAKTVWVRPEILAEVAYNNVTPDGHLRHATFLRLRDGDDLRSRPRKARQAIR